MTGFDPTAFETVVKGHCFEDFEVGRVFVHHWGRTITAGDNALFSAATCTWNPMYLNSEFARGHGHPDMVVNPMLVLCTAVGLSVEDLSEGGGPFLGLDGCTFRAPVHPGGTLTATSQVVAARPSQSRPDFGIVTWRTEARDQHGSLVVDFTRSNLVRRRGGGGSERPAGGRGKVGDGQGAGPARPAGDSVRAVQAPAHLGEGVHPAGKATVDGHPLAGHGARWVPLTGDGNYFEDFTVGRRVHHARAATVGEIENSIVSKLVMNTAQAHWNEHFLAGAGQRGRAAGGLDLGSGRLVFGLVTASMVFGLASQDTTENALAELGCDKLRFLAPVHHGDTLHAYTEVLDLHEEDWPGAGVVRFRHWGVDHTDGVVFEGERTVLVKRRPDRRRR
ncbi:MAG: MaoC family dehydratase [Acidimicrobiales bacterium]